MSVSLSVDLSLWKTQMDKAVKQVTDAVDNTIKTVSKRLLQRIVDYTPVGDPTLWHWPAHADYVPGQLKASWTLRFEGKEAIIENKQPYALRVEYGWSTQAPEGMMRRAALDYPILLGRTAQEFKL